MIGIARSMKRIMSRTALQEGRITKARQDGNREFITCLACVNALGRKIPPVLIYPGTSGDLWSSWVQDVDSEDEVFFGVTANGWSSHKMGLAWLQKVFERFTKPKTLTTKRLLILDGHSSHINMAFVDWADAHGIILMVLPPHTTHRLQPLDVGLFQPLSTAYSKGLNELMSSTFAFISMTKPLFYSIFKDAWNASFTEKNIQSAWKKSGIFPLDPDMVISKITRTQKKPSEEPKLFPATPTNAVGLRQLQRKFIESPTPVKTTLLFETLEELITKVSILKLENEGLQNALVLQKKKNKKSKRLNLVGEETFGAECWSPNKVALAKAFQDDQEAKEIQLEADKQIKKLQREKEKKQKEAAKDNKEVGAQLAREMQTLNPPILKPSKLMVKNTKEPAKKPSKEIPISKNKPKEPSKDKKVQPKALSLEVQSKNVMEGDISREEGKRSVRLPQRFFE